MKTVYFVRHGESEANAKGIAAGGGLDIGLTAEGRRQAEKAGQELKGKGVELIVSSPMKRAFESATIIANTLGLDPGKIVTSKLFTERHLGELTGVTTELIKTYYDMGALPASAEKTEVMHARIVEGLEWLKTLDADKIVLVSHGGPGRMIRAIYREEHHGSINTLSRMGNAQTLELHL
jgi:uncharacterized phosphatase